MQYPNRTHQKSAHDPASARPPHVLLLSKEEPGTHLSIIACPMVLALRNTQPGAQISEAIASERIDFACCCKRASPFQIGKMYVVKVSRMLKATSVKWHVMRNESVELIEIKAFDFLPHFIKLRSIASVFGSYAMDLDVEIMIKVILRPNEPGSGLGHLTATHDTYSNLAHRRSFCSGGLKVNSYEIPAIHF